MKRTKIKKNLLSLEDLAQNIMRAFIIRKKYAIDLSDLEVCNFSGMGATSVAV